MIMTTESSPDIPRRENEYEDPGTTPPCNPAAALSHDGPLENSSGVPGEHRQEGREREENNPFLDPHNFARDLRTALEATRMNQLEEGGDFARKSRCPYCKHINWGMRAQRFFQRIIPGIDKPRNHRKR